MHKKNSAGKKITMKSTNYTNTITADTIYQKANSIAIKAIKTNWKASGSKFCHKLFISACVYAMSDNVDDDGNGGADIIQTVALYLAPYIGRDITDLNDDGEIGDDGEPVSILYGAFRAANKVLKRNRKIAAKVAFLEDYENGAFVRVPREWDIDSVYDLREIEGKIDSLNLTETQKSVLNARLQGASIREIARRRGVSHVAIIKTISQIQAKYIAIYGKPATVK